MSDRLEQTLFDLGRRIEFPETPVFAIPAHPSPAVPKTRRGWLVAAAAAAAFLILMAFPGPRSAVAGLFGIGSISITMVDELPEAAVATRPSGVESSLEEAQRDVDFSVMTIDAEPDAVFLDTSVPGGMVTLGYGKGDGTYRLLITELQAETDINVLEKSIASGTSISTVTVGAEDGFWIEGGPHVVVLFDRDGHFIEDSARLAGNTLLFVRDGVTVRIEGTLELEQAREIASQLQS